MSQGFLVGGTYLGTVQKDLIETVKDKNELFIDVIVHPFYTKKDKYPLTRMPYMGYLPPIKKDDKVLCIPLSGDTDKFIVFAWLGAVSSQLTSSLLLEKAFVATDEKTLEVSGVDGKFKMTATDQSFELFSDPAKLTIKGDGTIFEIVSEASGLKITSSKTETKIEQGQNIVSFGATGASLQGSAGVNVKTSAGDMGAIIGELMQWAMTISTMGSPVKQFISPESIAQLVPILAKWKAMIGGA